MVVFYVVVVVVIALVVVVAVVLVMVVVMDRHSMVPQYGVRCQPFALSISLSLS